MTRQSGGYLGRTHIEVVHKEANKRIRENKEKHYLTDEEPNIEKTDGANKESSNTSR